MRREREDFGNEVVNVYDFIKFVIDRNWNVVWCVFESIWIDFGVKLEWKCKKFLLVFY